MTKTEQLGFRKELESLLNSWCKENESNTPDFILADYLINCLDNFDKAVVSREKWYGRTCNNCANIDPSDGPICFECSKDGHGAEVSDDDWCKNWKENRENGQG